MDVIPGPQICPCLSMGTAEIITIWLVEMT
jgi:hypothetical protein